MRLDFFQKTLADQLCHLAVVGSSGASQKRLVCRILNQRMFEDVTCTRRPAALVKDLVLD